MKDCEIDYANEGVLDQSELTTAEQIFGLANHVSSKDQDLSWPIRDKLWQKMDQ